MSLKDSLKKFAIEIDSFTFAIDWISYCHYRNKSTDRKFLQGKVELNHFRHLVLQLTVYLTPTRTRNAQKLKSIKMTTKMTINTDMSSVAAAAAAFYGRSSSSRVEKPLVTLANLMKIYFRP